MRIILSTESVRVSNIDDVLTNEVLRDNGQLYDALEDAEQRAEAAFSEGEQI